MDAEFIEIEKLTTETILGVKSLAVKKESIRISHIQRFRAWYNKEGENEHTSGEITNITMKEDAKTYDIKIAESIDAFTERMNLSIMLKHNVGNNAKQGDKKADTKEA